MPSCRPNTPSAPIRLRATPTNQAAGLRRQRRTERAGQHCRYQAEPQQPQCARLQCKAHAFNAKSERDFDWRHGRRQNMDTGSDDGNAARRQQEARNTPGTLHESGESAGDP